MSILSTLVQNNNAGSTVGGTSSSGSSGSGSSGASAAQAAGTSASQQLAGNFDTFLQLLTTQLQNQDPFPRSTPTSSPNSWSSSLALSNRST